MCHSPQMTDCYFLPDIEGRVDIERALKHLSWRQRQVIILRYLRGFLLREIANVTHLTIERCRQIEHEALKLMRKQMERKYDITK